MDRATRCIWTNHPSDDLRDVSPPGFADTYPVCPEHEAELREYLARAGNALPWFVAAIFVTIFSALAPVFWDSSAAIAIPLFTLGLTLIAFPFATPMTLRRGGIQPSTRLLRGMGVVMLLAGCVFVAGAIV